MPRARRRDQHSFFRHLIVGAVLGLLALSLGRTAHAADMEDFVNAKIKEEFIKVEGEELRATVEFPTPEKHIQSVSQWPRPMDQIDPSLQNVKPTTLGEQSGTDEMPRPGIERKDDPTDPLEQKVVEKQAYEMYRDNYRHKVQEAFIQQARKAGWIINRNIAAEIKAQEDLLPKPY